MTISDPKTPHSPAHAAPHVVMSGTESDAYRSLRRKAVSRAERFDLGRRLRLEVPRKAFGAWKPPADRRDPVEQIKHSHEGRLEELIPVRVARMVASPYGFYAARRR
jgi:hypothetical protein